MKRIDSTTRTTSLLAILSIMYALFDMKMIFLAPIITIVIPYKFMKEKDSSKTKENRSILNNLYLFNILTFLGVMLIMDKTNYNLIEILVNIAMTFIYFKLLSSTEKKREELYTNPEKVYEKINQEIEVLELVYEKAQQAVENEQDEKIKSSNQIKADVLKLKIDEYKRQLEFLEKQIKFKNSNSQ